MVYNAAAAGAPADVLICHNLYDFGRVDNSLALSRFAGLRHVSGFPAVMSGSVRALTRLHARLRLPFGMLSRFNAMVDERDTQFYETWKQDPFPVRWVTLRYLESTFTTPPRIPLEANKLPVLVINPIRDRMVSPAVTEHNYERLGGDKQYRTIEHGHWATGDAFISLYAQIVDSYFRSRMTATSG
jgi:hypothetical protein